METAKFTHHKNTSSPLRRLVVRFLGLVLVAVIITFPSWKDVVDSPSLFSHPIALEQQGSNAEIMSLLLHNLSFPNSKVAAAAFISRIPDFSHNEVYRSNDFDLKVIHVYDFQKQSEIPDGHFDLAFTDLQAFNFNSALGLFIDRTVKLGGIVAIKISRHHPSSYAFAKPSNYRTLHFRRFQYSSAVLILKKIAYKHRLRRLFSYVGDWRKAAVLENLEDVLLEPPRAASRKSWRYRKRTRYLPDLMGDSLEGYPRRVFIDVGGSEGGTKWFMANYPTRNLDFDLYRIEMLPEELGTNNENTNKSRTTTTRTAVKREEEEEVIMSDWMRKNIREEEYVVMKAEAEVVEEVAKSKSIRLVDELFLECKLPKNGNESRRAYWECLALYGKLRDEGVAVHQWWG